MPAALVACLLQDMETLSTTNPDFFKELNTGKFAVQTSSAEFSMMAFDQCHEQNNKKIKAISGYINMVNTKNEKFLRQLEICTPEIQEYLKSGENKQTSQGKHKEEST